MSHPPPETRRPGCPLRPIMTSGRICRFSSQTLFGKTQPTWRERLRALVFGGQNHSPLLRAYTSFLNTGRASYPSCPPLTLNARRFDLPEGGPLTDRAARHPCPLDGDPVNCHGLCYGVGTGVPSRWDQSRTDANCSAVERSDHPADPPRRYDPVGSTPPGPRFRAGCFTGSCGGMAADPL